MSTDDENTWSDFTNEWNERVDKCKDMHEAFIVTSGLLLTFLSCVQGEQFNPIREHPNTWPTLLANAMRQISAMRGRTAGLTDWLRIAQKTVAAMRGHGVSVPN